MAKKKLTIEQRNRTKIEALIKQKVATSKGFLSSEFKHKVAEDLIAEYNKRGKLITSKVKLQDRYNRYGKAYDLLFNKGLTGHSYYTNVLTEYAKKASKEKTDFYIREHGEERKVSYSELAYKIELLSHKLSVKHDIAFTKFKPTYYLIGKGKYKIVINIPNLKEVDFEEMTTEEVLEWFDDNNIEIILSDPTKIKGKEAKEKWEKSKKRRQKSIKATKEKYYRQWKKKGGKK